MGSGVGTPLEPPGIGGLQHSCTEDSAPSTGGSVSVSCSLELGVGERRGRGVVLFCATLYPNSRKHSATCPKPNTHDDIPHISGFC